MPHEPATLAQYEGLGSVTQHALMERTVLTMPVSHPVRALDRRAFLGALVAPAVLAGTRWTQFRGDGSSSVADNEALPLEWSDQKNVSWSVTAPGYGQSSPVVWDGLVFITSTAGKHKEEVHLIAVDTAVGSIAWKRTLGPAQQIEDSDMVSKAAPTAAVDADRVCAFFETGDLAAFTHAGKPLWHRKLTQEFGEFGGRHGIGSSLCLCRKGVLVLVAHDGPSYLLCVDRETGKTVWKTDRPKGVLWSTPTIAEHGGREIALVSGRDRVDAYDTEDGSLLWTLESLTGAFVASPTPMPGGAIIGSGDKGQTAAIRFSSNRYLTPEIVWRASEAASYFSSPLVHQARVYMVNKAGVAFCLNVDSGQEVWHARLKGQCWASPIATREFVYFFGVGGVVEIYRTADSAEKIAENQLSEQSRLYGVGVSGEKLLLRFGRRLVCIHSLSGGGEEPSADHAVLWKQSHAVEMGNG